MFGFMTKPQEFVPETFDERLKKIERRIMNVEAEVLDVMTSQNILRNKVLKKIQFKNPKIDEEEEEPKQDLYNGMFPKS